MEHYVVSPADPTHQRAIGNLKYFEYQLAKQRKEEEELKEDGAGTEEKEVETPKTGRPADYLPERKKYEQLCRGEGIKMVRGDAEIWTCAHTQIHFFKG